MIPYGRQDINDDDLAAVIDVLNSDFITQGPAVPAFEKAVSSMCFARHGIAVSSATAALHIGLLALGVSEGDIVWTSPNTFVASANAALYCGASVSFVDISLQSYNMCINALAQKLQDAEINGTLPKVVIPVHLTGQSCDMRAIYELSKRYNFKILEDASHAIGGLYEGVPIGSGAFSDITVFSFHPVKIITTGEGGMAVTNDDELAHKMALLRSHGITRDPKLMSRSNPEPWFYEQVILGFNYRMTDIQAALGLSQTKRLQEFIDQRHKIASFYNRNLKCLPVILPKQCDFSHSAYHLYVIRLQFDNIPCKDKEVLVAKLKANGILVNVHYIPVHTQPFYRRLGFKVGDYPNAETYYREAISLPMYPTLSKDDQHTVIESLGEILTK